MSPVVLTVKGEALRIALTYPSFRAPLLPRRAQPLRYDSQLLHQCRWAWRIRWRTPRAPWASAWEGSSHIPDATLVCRLLSASSAYASDTGAATKTRSVLRQVSQEGHMLNCSAAEA